jgi:hypothetical protein
MMWLFGALYGGYVMANVLKWFWWRFNGHGYFWGMMAGIVGAMIPGLIVFASKFFSIPEGILSFCNVNPLYLFPILLLLSLIGCLLGTYLGEAEDDAILKNFYKTVRPWGCWGPIRDQVIREDPAFQPNRDFVKDWTNVFVGLVWQLCLTALPIYLVLRSWQWVGAVLVTLLATSIFLKFNWFDKLPPAETA